MNFSIELVYRREYWTKKKTKKQLGSCYDVLREAMRSHSQKKLLCVSGASLPFI